MANQVLSTLVLLVTIPVCAGWLLSRQVCYGDLGCFSTDPPFRSTSRPITLLPQDPATINTQFFLLTRDNSKLAAKQLLNADEASTLRNSLIGNRTTKFIIHGFTHSIQEQWVQDMITEILIYENANIIVVDWSGGAQLPYTQATANTRLVGAQLAKFLKFLQKESGLPSESVHCIGHSLGAHVCGYAGVIVTNIARISGLDPAGPYFENTDPLVRLDPTDAKFVDVIHTDASGILSLGLGLEQAIGHADFYPNGGYEQPGCKTSILSKLGKTLWNAASLDKYGVQAALGCNHMRVLDLFIESINTKCPFMGYQCSDLDNFKTGKCLSQCQQGSCGQMGYHASAGANGQMYLMTQQSAPYCGLHYAISMEGAKNQKKVRGNVLVNFRGNLRQSNDYQITESDSSYVEAGQTLNKLLLTTTSFGHVSSLTTYFKKYSSLLSWLYPDSWKLAKATVTSGEGKYTSTFCADGASIYNGARKTFRDGGSC